MNSENRAVITDFGSARAVESSPTEARSEGHHKANEVIEQHRNATGSSTMCAFKAEIAASGKSITMTGPAWTVRWAAPELLKGELPRLESDIWAFGWVCWEVRQCAPAIANMFSLSYFPITLGCHGQLSF